MLHCTALLKPIFFLRTQIAGDPGAGGSGILDLSAFGPSPAAAASAAPVYMQVCRGVAGVAERWTLVRLLSGGCSPCQ